MGLLNRPSSFSFSASSSLLFFHFRTHLIVGSYLHLFLPCLPDFSRGCQIFFFLSPLLSRLCLPVLYQSPGARSPNTFNTPVCARHHSLWQLPLSWPWVMWAMWFWSDWRIASFHSLLKVEIRTEAPGDITVTDRDQTEVKRWGSSRRTWWRGKVNGAKTWRCKVRLSERRCSGTRRVDER